MWQKLDTNWTELKQFLDWADKLNKKINTFLTDDSEKYFYECLKLILEGKNSKDEISCIKEISLEVSKLLFDLKNKLTECNESGAGFNIKKALNNAEWLISLKNLCERRKQNLKYLRQWLDYSKFREGFLQHEQFKNLIDYLEKENNDLKNKDIKELFNYNFHRKCLELFYDENNILKKYHGSQLDQIIEKFKGIDHELFNLSITKIRDKILSSMAIMDNSNIHVLKRESSKKRGHKSIRKLFLEIPELMQSLAPCLLMSPVSIAQYLPKGKVHFDCVIFDEASQIPPWDAMGAILRASQCIIVGDRKQLPPTSFFDSTNDDFNSEETNETLDSILEESVALNLPEIILKGHYRSEHESLITFSNQKYYNNNLITFPSNKTTQTELIYKKIKKGDFEPETNTSKSEAVEIVNMVKNWLSSDNFNSSIGIVTFNIHQQKLIEELFENERLNDSRIDSYFSDSRNEPIIIKNLENIQGDERDIIILSIGFGPIGQKELSMNFGPLNKEGGEKRLNVAITRARKRMYVCTGLEYGMIDLRKTSARGMNDLRHFLEYAEKGPSRLLNDNKGSVGGYESLFEKEVADALVKLGWRIQPQIGIGTKRIDIGVEHPEYQNKFLAGIECDGATYHSSATARDRDVIRQNMLEKLGWKIIRVWSTNWWYDQEKEISKLDEKLRQILQQSGQNK